MTFTEAALAVLEHEGRPLHIREIAELAVERGLLSHVGKTPVQTMSARLSAAVAQGEEGGGPFVRLRPGVFALSKWGKQQVGRPAPKAPAKSIAKPSKTKPSPPAAEDTATASEGVASKKRRRKKKRSPEPVSEAPSAATEVKSRREDNLESKLKLTALALTEDTMNKTRQTIGRLSTDSLVELTTAYLKARQFDIIEKPSKSSDGVVSFKAEDKFGARTVVHLFTPAHKGSIDEAAIQKLRSVLKQIEAHRGIIISSKEILKSAVREIAASGTSKVELHDAESFAEALVHLGIGVTMRQVTVAVYDEAFFKTLV